MSRMRAAGIAAPREARLGEIEIPTPGAGEVRVRVAGCGICGSNLPLWLGRPWFQYPTPFGAPGHEPWGVVDAVGPGVAGVEPGARVAFLAERAFAEFAIAAQEHLVALPPALDGHLVPAEPFGCGVNAFERAAIRPGERVAIVGLGFLGAVLTILARRAGACVTAVSRRRFALDTARALGADRVATLDGEPLEREAFACVIEAAGEQRTLDVASQLVAERGRLVIAGYHQDGARQVDLQSWNWRGLDVINAHERDPRRYVLGMRRAVALIADGAIEPARLVTHVFPLQRIQEAFEAAAARPDGFLKAVVMST